MTTTKRNPFAASFPNSLRFYAASLITNRRKMSETITQIREHQERIDRANHCAEHLHELADAIHPHQDPGRYAEQFAQTAEIMERHAEQLRNSDEHRAALRWLVSLAECSLSDMWMSAENMKRAAEELDDAQPDE